MSATHETRELPALCVQGREHVEHLQGFLAAVSPPARETFAEALARTRGLRGAASLLGQDVFQVFLGRLFQILEDLESGEVPWSSRLQGLLRQAAEAEAGYLARLQEGNGAPDTARLEQVEEMLSAWRRSFEPENAIPMASPEAGIEIEATVQQLRRLRRALASPLFRDAVGTVGWGAVQSEIVQLQDVMRDAPPDGAAGTILDLEGLRNHCEGALRHLVEAAAQEVLQQARERGLRLTLRATGHLDTVEEPLGSALLEILGHLWSDSLEMQAAHGAAEIDTVLRREEARLVVEICDPMAAANIEDDILGRYPGLRHSRPLVEALHGLVWVEPKDTPRCRFRLALSASTERPYVTEMRVGRHEIALPTSAIEEVYAVSAVRTGMDAAGAFVEVGGMRVPILHLAFLLGDVSFDEMVRQHLVVIGSFERRAAMYASEARRAGPAKLGGNAQGFWAGTVDTTSATRPLVDVAALFGRPAAAGRRSNGGDAEEEDRPMRVLVVDSSEIERARLQGLLQEQGWEAWTAPNAAEAWNLLEDRHVDVLLCDLRLPEMNAQQMAERRQRSGRNGDIPMLLVLSQVGEQSHLVVQQLGASAWVRSPVQPAELLEAVKSFVVR